MGKEYDVFANIMPMENMRVIIYGIGKRYQYMFSLQEEIDIGLVKNRIEVVGFSDGDSNKWGTSILYEGHRFIIRNILDFCTEDFDKIVITSIQKYEEIRCELMQKGYEEGKILLVDQLSETNPERIYYENHVFFSRQWEKLRDTGAVKSLLQEKGYKRIVVYGTGKIADRLIERLTKETDITLEYLIAHDKNPDTDGGLDSYKPDDELPPADIIIAATLEHYMEIERTICENNGIEVISIQELVYKALKNVRGLERYA